MRNLSFVFFLLLFNQATGQKVDIDNFWIYISCADLPLNFVSEDERTYSISLNGNSAFTGDDKTENIKLYGWTKVDDNPSLEVKLNISAFRIGSAYATNRTTENKDKAGKVISKNTYYKVRVTNAGVGNMRIYGPKNEMTKAGSKKENTKEVKKEKNNEKKETNPFLLNVDKKDVADNLDDATSTKNLVYSQSLDVDYTYETPEYTTSQAANAEFNSNSGYQANNHQNSYRTDFPYMVGNYLNQMYGYKPYRNHARFKRLDSENHPEFAMFDNATVATKTIFSKMRYNKGIAEIEKDLAPIINYFEGLEIKYKSNDKQDKKLRGAALYNLARIYQYLDRHEKVFEIGEIIIASKNDEDDGKNFIKESEEILRKLEFHQMTSRHIFPSSKEQELDEEGEKKVEP